MGFGTETPEDEALTVIDAYVEAGGNVLDTSDVYGAGASETTLGRWFADRPSDITDRIVLATKGRFGVGPDIECSSSSRGSPRRHSTPTSCRPERRSRSMRRATTGRRGRGGVLGVRQRAVGRRRDDRQGRHGRKAELRYPAGRRAKQLRTLRRIVPARTFDKQILKFNRLPA